MAQKISTGNREIIFVPDRNLAQYVSSTAQCSFIIWEGYCPVHADILPEHILQAKSRHPRARVIVHPECKSVVTELADTVSSTEGMSRYIKNSTEKNLSSARKPESFTDSKKKIRIKFLSRLGKAICTDMKIITLEKVLRSLENLSYEITVSPDIADKARRSIERMLETL